MSETRDALATALAGHKMWENDEGGIAHQRRVGYCSCRAWRGRPSDFEAHKADILLALPGIAIVKLAKPTDDDIDGDQYFSEGSAAGNVLVTPGSGIVGHGDWEWTVEQAMDVGRQWISAALVADPNRTVANG